MKKSLKPYPGFFLTIEGGDGCGKSTLSHGLEETLAKKGASILTCREPGGTALSERLREILLEKDGVPISERAEMMLYLTARVQQLHESILPALHDGKVVICDRFNDSTLAYQGYARGLGIEEVEKICSLVCQELEPDCTLLLDLDPTSGLKRLQGRDRLESEALSFHEKVHQGYLHLADRYPERIHLLDASKSKEELLQQAIEIMGRCGC